MNLWAGADMVAVRDWEDEMDGGEEWRKKEREEEKEEGIGRRRS